MVTKITGVGLVTLVVITQMQLASVSGGNLQTMISNMKCRDGYQLNGTLTITQRSTVRVPNCKSGNKRCPNPGFPKGYSDQRDYYPHGFMHYTHCSAFSHRGFGHPYNRCNNGKWTSLEFACTKIGLSIERSDKSCGRFYVSSSPPPSGHFMSPGYPKNPYSESKTCSWTITSNTYIGLSFKTFQTESNYDFVKVYNGKTASAPLIGSYSGSTLPPYITGKYHVLHITFNTDASANMKGFAASFQALKSGSLRLVGGTTPRSGRVEIFYHNKWGTVCDDSWDMTDANVVCKQLGFPGAIAAHQNAKYGQGTDNIWLDQVQCKGPEAELLACPSTKVNPWVTHNCDHSEDAGVECQKRVRLVNGGASYGRVEVYHQGQWGTVCDDLWDINDANVVCKELGYSRASNAYGNAHYGQGSGPIWIDEVACLGSEKSLLSCGFRGWVTKNLGCSHSEDAGVKCV